MGNVKIGNLTLGRPIIQGGMGIGVSRCQLAGQLQKRVGWALFQRPKLDMTARFFTKNQKWHSDEAR